MTFVNCVKRCMIPWNLKFLSTDTFSVYLVLCFGKILKFVANGDSKINKIHTAKDVIQADRETFSYKPHDRICKGSSADRYSSLNSVNTSEPL